MGFNINETINTKLHYKDVALIAVAFGEYQRMFADTAEQDVLDRMKNLVNRLGQEIYDCPDDEPNGH